MTTQTDNPENNGGGAPTPTPTVTLTPEQQALVDQMVADALKPIKTSLDNAFAARDAAQRQLDERARQDREAEAKRLEEQGRIQEAANIRVQEERTAREQAERRVTELTRDTEIQRALSAVEFRNKNASEMAYQAILRDTVRQEDGTWKHASGVSIQEAVNRFVSSDENAFLLKPRQSSGGGSSAPVGGPTGEPSSLFKMSQAEVLELARQGKLPGRRRR